MKKLFIALLILGCTGMSADAQTTKTTTTVKKTTKTCKVTYGQNYKVCKKGSKYYTCGTRPATSTCTNMTVAPKTAILTSNKETPAPVQTTSGTSPYAKNYKVCKGNGDYHICNETPTVMNSVPAGTAQPAPTANKRSVSSTTVYPNGAVTTTSTQTYPTAVTNETQSTYFGNYPDQQNLSPVTVTGKRDTGINNANAPYHGKNSPQYDGVEKNKVRNLNTPPQSPNATFDGK